MVDSFEFINYPPPDLDAQAAVIAISHSGNSIVSVRAAEFARQRGAYTICMVGNPTGRLASAGDVTILDPGGIEENGPKIRSYNVTCFQGLLLSLLVREIKTGMGLDPKLFGLPQAVDRFIAEIEPRIKDLARSWAKEVTSYMVAGSGSDAGNASEIALKSWKPCPSRQWIRYRRVHSWPHFRHATGSALILMQGTPQGKKRCVEAAYAASAVTAKIMVAAETPTLAGPNVRAFWPSRRGLPGAFVLTPMPAQILVYYLCLELARIPIMRRPPARRWARAIQARLSPRELTKSKDEKSAMARPRHDRLLELASLLSRLIAARSRFALGAVVRLYGAGADRLRLVSHRRFPLLDRRVWRIKYLALGSLGYFWYTTSLNQCYRCTTPPLSRRCSIILGRCYTVLFTHLLRRAAPRLGVRRQ